MILKELEKTVGSIDIMMFNNYNNYYSVIAKCFHYPFISFYEAVGQSYNKDTEFTHKLTINQNGWESLK